MSKSPPPLLGFNNNVRHRGRIFHIQTEDSGVKAPRIVTHLFADGGRIVKTTRTDYSHHLQKSDMAVLVRAMMKEQHKAMFAALRAGELDSLLEDVCGPLEPATAEAFTSPPPSPRHDAGTARVVVGGVPRSMPLDAPSAAPRALAAAAAEAPRASAEVVIESLRSLHDSEPPRRPRRIVTNPNLRKPTPSASPPPPEAFDLDVASLDEHPPRSSRNPPPLRPPRKSSPAAARKPRSGAPARSAALDGVPSVGRPATRLAAAPQTHARSIFGDGAISEQSLDEVILSYLAEDLDDSK